MDYYQLLLLGLIAGFTIFLGLPLAVLQNTSPRKKGFLNAIAIGILVFLIIDVFSHAWQSTADSVKQAYAGKSSTSDALFNTLAMFGGLAIGLLGLVFYESRFMRQQQQQQQKRSPLSSSKSTIKKGEITTIYDERQRQQRYNEKGIKGSSSAVADTDDTIVADTVDTTATPGIDAADRIELQKQRQQQPHQQHRQQPIHEINAYKLSMMIAIGIGTHNFSEGLAIGQSFVSGAIGLALLLIIGFGSHNATEGFGIAGPLTGLTKKPKLRFIILLGLIGGGPTFLGTLIGSLWISNIAYILFLSIAGGALIYVSLLMYNSGRKLATNNIMMTGIFFGLCIGFITDLIITLGGA